MQTRTAGYPPLPTLLGSMNVIGENADNGPVLLHDVPVRGPMSPESHVDFNQTVCYYTAIPMREVQKSGAPRGKVTVAEALASISKGEAVAKVQEATAEPTANERISHGNKLFLPAPRAIEGVQTRSKVLLQMSNVSFQYSANNKPTISNLNLALSQASRVACTGQSEAGKSAIVKLLLGEQKPTAGSISKVAGLRIGYVAQRGIDNVDKHPSKSPVEYIMWRFARNEDAENVNSFRLVAQEDERQGATANVQDKELVEPSIESYLTNFGVNHKFASGPISQLSTSVKLKVVLAAAMWQRPHILILEEPTEPLQQEFVDALVLAFASYQGGVIVISDNKHFCQTVAMQNGVGGTAI